MKYLGFPGHPAITTYKPSFPSTETVSPMLMDGAMSTLAKSDTLRFVSFAVFSTRLRSSGVARTRSISALASPLASLGRPTGFGLDWLDIAELLNRILFPSASTPMTAIFLSTCKTFAMTTPCNCCIPTIVMSQDIFRYNFRITNTRRAKIQIRTLPNCSASGRRTADARILERSFTTPFQNKEDHGRDRC